MFWAMYMDREFVRDRKAKKRHTGPAANLPMAARGSKKKPTDEEIDLSMIGVSGSELHSGAVGRVRLVGEN